MSLFLLAALFSEIIGTFAGFGATTILLPIATFLMPVREAIVIVGLFHLFGTAWRTLFFARGINLKITFLFGIPSLVFSGLGALLLPQVDASILTKAVGFAIVTYASYALFKERVILPKSEVVLIGGGGLTGFLAGLIGTAGAMRGAFLTAWKLPKNLYLGTSALVGLGADITRVVTYERSGLISFSKETIFILVGVAFLGTLLGRIAVGRVNEKLFAKIVFLALVLAGLRLVFVK